MAGTSGPVVVLIFTHKPTLEWYEAIALEQCFRVLGAHPIRLVCPEGMDVTRYRAIAPALEVDSIPAAWFSSIANYNRLKMLPFLYRRYAGFEFMLTYELDAFVFTDDLLAWCAVGWDYIGAPWFEGYDEALPDAEPLGVGNSGFSLRRIATMLRIGTTLRYQKSAGEMIAAWQAGQYRLRGLVRSLTLRNNFFGPLNDYRGHEDTFWCHVAARRFPELRLAPYAVARRFSFEVNPARLFRECDQALPSGCHKWMKYEPEFWKPRIEAWGYRFPAAARRL